jgi:hypothetical protein
MVEVTCKREKAQATATPNTTTRRTRDCNQHHEPKHLLEVQNKEEGIDAHTIFDVFLVIRVPRPCQPIAKPDGVQIGSAAYHGGEEAEKPRIGVYGYE